MDTIFQLISMCSSFHENKKKKDEKLIKIILFINFFGGAGWRGRQLLVLVHENTVHDFCSSGEEQETGGHCQFFFCQL